MTISESLLCWMVHVRVSFDFEFFLCYKSNKYHVGLIK